jgi:hydrogenase expression/formation protein HypC
MCLGVPAKVIEKMANDIARVDVNGNQTEISIRLTPEVKLGEYVLVHAGFAMEIIDESVAMETMHYLEEMLQYEQ